MSPGVFRHVTPWFSASPDRGSTNPACPGGIAIAMPVGTSARPPAASIVVATRGAQVVAGVVDVLRVGQLEVGVELQ